MSNLALDLRPTSLDQVIGNAPVKKAIQSFIDMGSFPNCLLLSGPPGTGKTTLAHIIARAVQGDSEDTGFDIRQINGSDKNGVDDARQLAEDSASRPFIGKYRVFIIDEAHRLTQAAQDALLIPMETSEHTIWVLCSTDPSKLLPAIKSRCAAGNFELKPLDKTGLDTLVQTATCLRGKEADDVVDFLRKSSINAPREVLGVLDQYLSGMNLEDCVHGSAHEPLYKDVASAVLAGNWTKTAFLLAQIPTADYRGMVAMVSAFLAGALLKEPTGARADALATCLVGLGSNQFADGVAYAAAKGLLYKCAKILGGGK